MNSGAYGHRPVLGFGDASELQVQVPASVHLPWMDEIAGLSLHVWFAPGVQTAARASVPCRASAASGAEASPQESGFSCVHASLKASCAIAPPEQPTS